MRRTSASSREGGGAAGAPGAAGLHLAPQTRGARGAPALAASRQPPAAALRIGDSVIPLIPSQAQQRDHSQDKCRLGETPGERPGPGWP